MKTYKKAFVTGGATRIGLSIVSYLAELGLDVAVQFNSSKENINKMKNKFSKVNVKFEACQKDFSKSFSYEDFLDEIKKKFGSFDLLVNNASAFEFDTIKETNTEIFDKHISVNLKAPFFLTNLFVKQLQNKNGLIINIIDQRVKNITPYFSSYTLSKSGLYALTKNSSLFLSPNIRVNGISPGPTLKSKNQTTKQFKDQVKRTPLMRQVELKEINNAILYLMNNKSVTGEILTIDSGQSLGWANTKSKVFTSD